LALKLKVMAFLIVALSPVIDSVEGKALEVVGGGFGDSPEYSLQVRRFDFVGFEPEGIPMVENGTGDTGF
jgi:hypothetical protein